VGGASGISTLLFLGVQMLHDDFYGLPDLCQVLHSVKKASVVHMSVEGFQKLSYIISNSSNLCIGYAVTYGCDPAMAQDNSKPLSKNGILRYGVFLLKSHLFCPWLPIGLFLEKLYCEMAIEPAYCCTYAVEYKFH
jgi:hypothetical protein